MLKVTQMTHRDSKPVRSQRSSRSCLLCCLVSILLYIPSAALGIPLPTDWLGPRNNEIITARAVAAAGIPTSTV